MAPRIGFEPMTYRLTAGCSTAELSGNICKYFHIDDFSFLGTHAYYRTRFESQNFFIFFLQEFILYFRIEY